MTDRIDLDELTEETSKDEEENPGDWIWRDDADPPSDDAEPQSDDAPAPESPRDGSGGTDATTDTDNRKAQSVDTDATTENASSRHDDRPIPHVPHPNKGRPAGIPVEGGGAGGGTSHSEQSGSRTDDEVGEPDSEAGHTGDAAATGPHGGDADDMTLAFTFDAIRRLDDPATVLADARQWSDWIGIVGEVEAHVINKFQRDNALDVDFFNGTGTGPAERLGEIGPHSMFFAERMVVVGVPGRDESIAEAADWEFVDLETAATEADWALREP